MDSCQPMKTAGALAFMACRHGVTTALGRALLTPPQELLLLPTIVLRTVQLRSRESWMSSSLVQSLEGHRRDMRCFAVDADRGEVVLRLLRGH